MSTTVTYKGSTLTTVDNQTRTLKTAGKYMEGDVVLTDVSSGGSVPHVWQDQDGYVHLDDEGTPPITVEPLSVTQNGTYTASTGHAYSPVSVNVSGGVDMPTFTLIYSNDWTTLISVTCDKTYAECRQYLANDNYWASLTEKNQAGTEVYENVSCPTMTDQSGNDITYTATLSIRPSYDIKYHSDGTITVVNPSAYLETLNVTQNGLYFPTGGYIDEVNVNVPSGGITADDIAMRTISGSVGGSATTIHNYAFYQCNNLTTASFPSCTSIGNYAFYYCNNLTTASFPLCTSICSSAFAYCYSLTTASFSLCTYIGNSAFYQCLNLTTVSFPSCTTIGISAFYQCSSLTTASFPSCTSIGGSAFAQCLNLTTASFPLCTYIGNSAFRGCDNLTTASFPSCATISSYAFAYCARLTTASFPSCKSIGSSAFLYCSGLTTASFPLCTLIGGSAFYYCNRLTTAYFPSCTTIGTNAFFQCYSLTTANFPSCRTISSYAFGYCTSLTTADFPSCATIGSNAFYYCSGLTTASFPLCTSIGTSAFVDCHNLLSFYLLGSSVPTLGNSVFVSTPIGGSTASTGGVYGSIFVPASLYDSYITATNWSDYSARIVSM